MNTLNITSSEILLNGTHLKWGEHRDLIRNNLNLPYREDDSRTVFSTDFTMERSRDLFKDFFLHYNYNHKTLKELELHMNFSITITVKANIHFSMGDKFSDVLNKIKNVFQVKKLNQAEFFISELKMVIASGRAMGGDGLGLEYLYISNDASHITSYLEKKER